MSGEAKTPPKETSFLWCPVCGRDDRFTTFGSKFHFTAGERCEGTPVRVTYVLKDAKA